MWDSLKRSVISTASAWNAWGHDKTAVFCCPGSKIRLDIWHPILQFFIRLEIPLKQLPGCACTPVLRRAGSAPSAAPQVPAVPSPGGVCCTTLNARGFWIQNQCPHPCWAACWCILEQNHAAVWPREKQKVYIITIFQNYMSAMIYPCVYCLWPKKTKPSVLLYLPYVWRRTK